MLLAHIINKITVTMIRKFNVRQILSESKTQQSTIYLYNMSSYEKKNMIFRLNDELRSEYKQQSERFENMRVKYDEKFSILSEENKRLQDALPAETTD